MCVSVCGAVVGTCVYVCVCACAWDLVHVRVCVRARERVCVPAVSCIEFYMSLNGMVFSLTATVSHLNSVQSGHYIAFSKHAKTWFECNDDFVRVVPGERVVSEDTYLLVYERIGNNNSGSE